MTVTVDVVLEALEEQVEWYRRLAKLAELQHEHVQHSRMEELLELLARRQEVLDVVGRLEQTIRPARNHWSDYLAGLSESDRARASSAMGETRELLEQIVSADRNDALVLQQRKLNIGRQIDQAGAARQVNRQYAASAYTAPRRVEVAG